MDKPVSGAPIGSAGKIIYLLKLIVAGPHQFSLGDLAGRAQLPVSSVHRLLQEMVRSGLIERGKDQSYRTGRELHRLASQIVSRFDLTRSAHPLLEKLVEDWQETAVLCAYSPVGRNAVIADAVLTPHALRFAVEKGQEVSLPWGSLGRAILAFLPAGEIEAVMREAKAGPITGQPRSPRPEIHQDLHEIRANGFSRYYNPDNDIAGIASPIFDGTGAVLGCVGVTMPSQRYQLHIEDDLALAVRASASKLSERASIAQT